MDAYSKTFSINYASSMYSSRLGQEKNEVRYASHALLPQRITLTLSEKCFCFRITYFSDESVDTSSTIKKDKADSSPIFVLGKFTRKLLMVKIPKKELPEVQIDEVREMLTQLIDRTESDAVKKNYRILKNFFDATREQITSLMEEMVTHGKEDDCECPL